MTDRELDAEVAASAHFQMMVENNEWHDRSEMNEVIKTLGQLSNPNNDIFKDWNWSRSEGMRCKYITIQIDMRDGGFILKDRDGKSISLEQIRRQER